MTNIMQEVCLIIFSFHLLYNIYTFKYCINNYIIFFFTNNFHFIESLKRTFIMLPDAVVTYM